MSVLATVEAVYRHWEAGDRTYRLLDTNRWCWCGSPTVADRQDQAVCLETPFHDPKRKPKR